MKIIQFKENQKEVWNKFIAENSSESFLQAWEWGEFNRALGKKVWRIGIIENSLFSGDKTKESRIKNQESKIKLLSVALLVKCDLPLGRSYLYCPRGMVSRKFIKSKVYKVLFDEIRNIARKEKAMFLRFDLVVERNLESGIWNLEKKSPLPPFKKGGKINLPPLKRGVRGIFKKSPNEIQPRDTLILDLTKSEEELLKEMKPKTRYNIRLAGRKGLGIRYHVLGTENHESRITNHEHFKEKFEEFWKLTEETARRDGFKSHNKNYYWQMLENCRERNAEYKYGFVEKFHIPDEDMKLAEKERKFSFPTNLTAKLYLAEYENKIIAANIVLFFGDYCVYLHGASSSKYRNTMAPYLLQWRQIQDAKKMGCRKYDFWGVSQTSRKTVEPPPAPSFARRGKYNWGGITRFKKGFGGEERNYVGARDLVFDKWGYGLYRFIKKVKIIFNF